MIFAKQYAQIRRINGRERSRCFEEVARVIRDVELQGLAPELSLGASALNVGSVYYRTEASTVLRVANVGQG